jgi:hypothetical protein
VTRSGDTIRLVELLDEAVSRMEASLKERSAGFTGTKSKASEDELHSTAAAMGYGAVKYFDLRRNPTSNYIFSYDRMLDTKGNTAIYLVYAHSSNRAGAQVRAESGPAPRILRRRHRGDAEGPLPLPHFRLLVRAVDRGLRVRDAVQGAGEPRNGEPAIVVPGHGDHDAAVFRPPGDSSRDEDLGRCSAGISG